jgi:5'-deoxynucleotidase YfbR-like HD superfamily hydrolase
MTGRPPANDVARIFEFIVELDRLKAVLRRSKPVGIDRHENSAEHSWHACVLALLLARFSTEPVDSSRVVEMLLVHDIPEIDCGDHFVYSRDPAATFQLESAAASRIFGLLPGRDGERLLELWSEFEQMETPEARIARAADRLMPVLHNVFGGAQSWRENRVTVASTCPRVWAEIEPLIDSVFAGLPERASPPLAGESR